ncbi:MAG: hypothetical protein FWD68_18025 [Alphaproteobacteria bacterium]|nr:hypothetical protein [Alphaproteobacteria bacterium]
MREDEKLENTARASSQIMADFALGVLTDHEVIRLVKADDAGLMSALHDDFDAALRLVIEDYEERTRKDAVQTRCAYCGAPLPGFHE